VLNCRPPQPELVHPIHAGPLSESLLAAPGTISKGFNRLKRSKTWRATPTENRPLLAFESAAKCQVSGNRVWSALTASFFGIAPIRQVHIVRAAAMSSLPGGLLTILAADLAAGERRRHAGAVGSVSPAALYCQSAYASWPARHCLASVCLRRLVLDGIRAPSVAQLMFFSSVRRSTASHPVCHAAARFALANSGSRAASGTRRQ